LKIDSFRREIGEKIKKIRVEHGYTQAGFANEVLQISCRNLSRIENGQIAITVETLLAMTNTLKIDVQDLMYDVQNKHGIYEDIKKVIFKLERNPSADDLILKKLTKLYEKIDKVALTETEKNEIDWFYTVLMFKETSDHEVIDYFLAKTQHVPGLKMKAINFTQAKRKSPEIRKIVDEMLANEDKFLTVSLLKDGTPLALLLNSIGYLLDRGDLENIATYLKRLKKYIITNEKYYFLPIYHFRSAQFKFLEYDMVAYEKHKNKSLQLAGLFENKKMHERLIQEYNTFEEGL